MELFPNSTPCSQYRDRRTFLWSLASLGLTGTKPHKQPETIYRFLTPECEVEMSIQYFSKSSTNSFRFRDSMNNRVFCLSADGEEDKTCLDRFTGSITIARYRFRSRPQSQMPLSLRERVLTIDRDSRISARPPFKRVLPLDREIISDIQAFGYSPDDPKQSTSVPQDAWCILRQDLYLNDQASAFLIAHWKHTLNFISLVDLIPGDRTRSISE
jgi:hypothetical protein